MMYGQEDGYGSVPKKKGHGFVIGIILFLIILLVTGSLFYYKLYSKNSIELLLNATYEYLENAIGNSDYDSIVCTFSVQMKLQSADESENEIFSLFNKLDFSGKYGIDWDKGIMNFELKSDYDDKDLIDMSIYTEYGRAYIYLNNLYDKYIDTSVDNYSELFDRNLDDLRNIVIGVRRAMNGSLKDEYFTVEKVTVDGEKLIKTTLDLTNENYQEWNKNFTHLLLDNEIYLDSYAKIFDLDVEDIKKEVKNALEEEKDYEGEKYIVYTKNLEFVKIELSSPENRVVIKNNNDEYEYELYENGLEFASGTLKFDKKDTVSFSYYDNEEELGFLFTFSLLIEKNGKVDNKDVSNSISSEKISEDDVMSIYNKLMGNEGIVKIIEELSKLINNDSSLPMIVG